MPVDSFLSVITFFIFLCGSTLIFAAWPQQVYRPALIEVLTVALGSVMVLISGYGLAMVLA
ncbi:MAG: hypothetical protein WBA73_11920 [Devosia sp.]